MQKVLVNNQLENELRELVEVGRCDPAIPKSLTNAVQSLLTAMEYEDLALIKSYLETTCQEVAACVDEAIEKRLGWPDQARKAYRNILDQIKKRPSENWDEVAAKIGSMFDTMIDVLTDMLEGPAKKLQDKGCELKNIEQLKSDIMELKQIKKYVLDSWPWSNQELPPVDVEMLNASMTAIKNGSKGESIDDLIRRLGGELQGSK